MASKKDEFIISFLDNTLKVIEGNKISIPESKPKKEEEIGVNAYCAIESMPEMRFNGRSSVPIALEATIVGKHYVPEIYWYLDDTSASTYHHVTDTEDYDLSESTIQLLKDNFDDIVMVLSTDSEWVHSKQLSLVDLGVGTPIKDIWMMTKLRSHLSSLSREPILNYIPVDISYPLAAGAALNVWEEMKDKVVITMFIGDFTKIHKHKAFFENKGKKIITLLGTTIGNLNIVEMLDILKKCMNPGDYLAIDFEFADYYEKDENAQDELKKRYNNEPTKQFILHPIQAVFSKHDFQRELTKVVVQVGDPINIEIIQTVNNKNINNKPIHALKDSIIVCMSYHTSQGFRRETGAQGVDEILLAWNIKHTRESTENLLKENFEIAGFYPSKDGGRYGMYLLRRNE